MKKVVCLTLVLSSLIAAPTFAQTVPSSQNIKVDGVSVDAQGYNIDGNNYFKLRDIAALLAGKTASFDVNYNESKKAIEITRDADYTKLDTDLVKSADNDAEIKSRPSFQKVFINNELVLYDAYFINGNNYFKVRDLGKTIGFYVDFDKDSNTIIIKSQKLPPKDLIKKESVSFVDFITDGKSKIPTYKFNEKTSLTADDFLKQMGSATLLTTDNRRYSAKVEYNGDNNTFLMTPLLFKIKGQLYFKPYVKVEQNNKVEYFDYSRELNLNELFKNYSKDDNLVLTLGYYVGSDHKPQDFRGACVVNFTK